MFDRQFYRHRRMGRHTRAAAALLVALLLVAACNFSGGASPNSAPSITVRQPTSGVQVGIGDVVKIVAQAADAQGILQVELWVDGELASKNEAPSTTGLKSFNAAFVWTASEAGDHTIVVKAVDTDQQIATAPDVMVRVVAAAAPTQTPAPPVQATATVEPSAATPAGTPLTVTVAPTAGEAPQVTADDTVNVRSGPGTNYDVLGQLTSGETVRVTGRNADSTWWQIVFTDAPDGKGWVFGQLVTPNEAAQSAPVADAPPPPTAAPQPTSPPATATSAPATATTVPVFRADRTSLNAGECTTMRWDVDDVIGVYFNAEGVGGHDSREVCPGETTTYSLRVVRSSGEQTYTLTITVQGSTGCSGEPNISHAFESTASSVRVNTPFSLVWQVTNVKEVWIVEDGNDIPAVGTGPDGGLATMEFSYGTPGTHHYKFKLKKCNGNFYIQSELDVTITATLAPVRTPAITH
jgi:uncharacterized protein YgiM (DUF1202 family)